MTWTWSHTTEAYEAARHNLSAFEEGTLQEMLAEWRTYAALRFEADPDGHQPRALRIYTSLYPGGGSAVLIAADNSGHMHRIR